MKKIILGALMAILITPSASLAYTPLDTTTIDVSAYTSQESLEELRILLMKQIIVLLQQRIQELIALRDGTLPVPVVLGVSTSTTSATTETVRTRSGGGGGGGSSRASQAAAEQAEINELQQTVEDLLAELGQLEEDQTTIEELQAIIASLEASLAERDAEILDFQTQIDALNDDINELEGDNAATALRVQQLESLNTELEQTIAERDIELAELQTSLNELTAQQVTNTASIAELETAKNNLLSTIATLETQIELANTTDVEQAAAIALLQGEVSTLQTDITTINLANAEEVSQLESEITEIEGQLATLEQNQIDNEAEIEALKASIASLESQLLTQTQAHAVALASIETQLSETNERLTLSESALAQSVVDLTQEKLDRESDVAALNTQITNLEEQVATQANSIATLQETVDRLTAQKTELEEKVEGLEGLITTLQAAIGILTTTKLIDFKLNEADDIVYIGEDDAVLTSADIQFSNDDARVVAIEIEFVSTPENVNLWEVFSSLSLWIDGDKIAEAPTGSPDGSLWETATGALYNTPEIQFSADETRTLYIASDINSEAGLEAIGLYEIEVRQIQYLDGDGNFQTVTDFEDVGVGKGVVFEIDELGGETLNFSLSTNNPDSATLLVDASSKSDSYVILIFGVDAEDGPVYVDNAYVLVETPNSAPSDVIDDSKLLIGGQNYNRNTVIQIDGNTEAEIHVFEIQKVFTEISHEVEFQVEFENQEGNYDVPQSVSASIDLDTRSLWQAEGYDDLNPATDFFGTVFGEIHTLMVDGLLIGDVETSSNTLGENDTVGEFTIEFEVTAFEDDFYFTDNVGTGVTDGIQYRIDGPDAVSSISAVVSSTASEEQPGVYVIQEGETETVTLQVAIQVSEAGVYRLALESLFFTNNFDGVTNTRPTVAVNPTDLRTNYQAIQPSI